MGYNSRDIAAIMAALTPVGTRLDVMEGIGDSLLILDSFTSDFGSLPSALDFMARRRTSGRTSTVILSDLVCDSRRVSPSALYSAVADLLRRKDIDRVVGIGPKSREPVRHSPPGAIKRRFSLLPMLSSLRSRPLISPRSSYL